jgi:UDP-N-acetylmuramate--alanine ligase
LPRLLTPQTPVHFIGVGGIGMSALAKILVDRGHPVSGSDPRDNATVQHLESRGVTVFKQQTAESIQAVLATNQQPPVVVISTAIPDTNPELENARAH